MNFLDNLMGENQQQDYAGFVDRYEQGHPAEGYDDGEVLDRHQQVASQLPPDQYQEAAQQAFDRMSPDERQEFGQHLQQQAQVQGYDHPDLANASAGQLQSSGFLSQIAGHMQGQQPGLLGQLLGGGGAGGLGGMLGGGGSGGGLGSMLGGGGSAGGGAGSLLSNPMAKAALAGIASFAVKKMMNR